MKVPIVEIVIASLIFIFLLTLAARFIPRRLDQSRFMARWKELQSYCRHRETWPKALEEADKLLNYALKKQKFRGKSMGEKMVSAQKIFTDNDSLWRAHNLFKKMADSTNLKKIRESDVKDALVGFRQALKDIGALPKDESK